MKLLTNLLKKEKAHQTLLAIVFALYIIMDIQTPYTIAPWIDSVPGNVIVTLLAISMFMVAGPIAGVLGIVAAYILIKRSSKKTGSYYLQNNGKAEEIKMKMLETYNDFPKTLEETVVQHMAPLVKHSPAYNSNYTPVLDKLHDAAPIHYDGVI